METELFLYENLLKCERRAKETFNERCGIFEMLQTINSLQTTRRRILMAAKTKNFSWKKNLLKVRSVP